MTAVSPVRARPTSARMASRIARPDAWRSSSVETANPLASSAARQSFASFTQPARSEPVPG